MLPAMHIRYIGIALSAICPSVRTSVVTQLVWTISFTSMEVFSSDFAQVFFQAKGLCVWLWNKVVNPKTRSNDVILSVSKVEVKHFSFCVTIPISMEEWLWQATVVATVISLVFLDVHFSQNQLISLNSS